METFLEIYNLPKLNKEEIESINRPTTSTEIETVMEKLSQQTSMSRWLHRWIQSNFWRRVNIYPSETLPKNFRERNTAKLIQEVPITLISNHTKTSQKGKLQGNSTEEHRCKNPQQNSSKTNPTIY